MKNREINESIAVLAVAAGMLAMAAPAFANATITAKKTLDICTIDSTHDRYSGLIAVTNTGPFPGIHLKLNDCIGGTLPSCSGGILVPGSGTGPWVDATSTCTALPFGGFNIVPNPDPNFPVADCAINFTGADTTVVFSYTVDGIALPLPITNTAQPTIQNFQCNGCGDKGPTVTATVPAGTTLKPCSTTNFGCTFTIGFWKQPKHFKFWPAGFSPNMGWFPGNQIGTETFLSALTPGPTHNNGYWILARQYVGAVLNQAKNGGAPASVITAISDAATFFSTAVPSQCDPAGSCGDQKNLAAILDTYNSGLIPGGPKECQ